MIDLHTILISPTARCRRGEWVEEAARVGFEALAITDHDTGRIRSGGSRWN
jgi:hypothetical protein